MKNRTIDISKLSKRYNFYNDPAHGWLEVPRADAKLLGITRMISGYSYQHGDMIYLEEDSDRAIFVKAWICAHGLDPLAKESWKCFHQLTVDCYEHCSHVREFARFI